MAMFSAFPLLGIVVLAYCAMALTGSLDTESVAFSARMASGAVFTLKTGAILVLAGLLCLFFEIIKSARVRSGTVLDHMLSTFVFIAALVLFLLVPFAATSTFFLIMCMSLLDVIAGFTVSIFSARRDYTVGHDNGGL